MTFEEFSIGGGAAGEHCADALAEGGLHAGANVRTGRASRQIDDRTLFLS
jgi:hypothetical protein